MPHTTPPNLIVLGNARLLPSISADNRNYDNIHLYFNGYK